MYEERKYVCAKCGREVSNHSPANDWYKRCTSKKHNWKEIENES